MYKPFLNEFPQYEGVPMVTLHKQVPLLKWHSWLQNEHTNVESHDRKGQSKDWSNEKHDNKESWCT